MREIFATLEKREYPLDSRTEFVQLAVFSFLAFSIPFILPHPQLVTGVAVNAFLVAAALSMKGRNVLPVILLPSIGALANGLLFGPFTIFLVYMIPFIWIGNFMLVYGIKHFMGRGYWVAGVGSSLIKALAIFLPAHLLYAGGILPEAMLLPMGLVQAGTAISGVALVGIGRIALGRK